MSEEHPAIGGPDPLIGSTLAERYRIERKLGEGGMGAVYLARHVILEKVVALKVLHDEYSRRRELVERFLHEAKAASRIRHEHVIDITDFGETASKNVFFAMEYLEGTDLAQELDRIGRLPWPRAKHIALQLCSALQAAHEAGVIHRDLKPENIYLIERQGSRDYVKVLDFGVAKLIELEEGGRRLTRTGMVFGTPEYMSPEQARGDKPDTRVDVYALGCILFEMITGDVPFRADNFMGVLTKHLFEPSPKLVERCDRNDYPSGLQAVVDEAMQKDRQNRFATMNELSVALDTLVLEQHSGPNLSTRTITPPPPAPARTPSNMELEPTRAVPTVPPVPAITLETEQPPRSRAGLWAALGLLLVGGAAGGGWYYYGASVEEPQKVAPVAAPVPAPVPVPAPAPDPAPAPVPAPAPAPVTDPVAAPAPTPDPVADPPVADKKPDRRRNRRPRTTAAAPPPVIASPPPVVKPTPPAPDPTTGGTTIRPKSGLKDPFKKK